VQDIREALRIERSVGQFNYLAQSGLDSGSVLSFESSATNSHGENNAEWRNDKAKLYLDIYYATSYTYCQCCRLSMS